MDLIRNLRRQRRISNQTCVSSIAEQLTKVGHVLQGRFSRKDRIKISLVWSRYIISFLRTGIWTTWSWEVLPHFYYINEFPIPTQPAPALPCGHPSPNYLPFLRKRPSRCPALSHSSLQLLQSPLCSTSLAPPGLEMNGSTLATGNSLVPEAVPICPLKPLLFYFLW